MIFKISDYIVDYERVNELTSHEGDKPYEGFSGLYLKGARGIIRKHLKNFEEISLNQTAKDGQLEIKNTARKHMINSLIYNRILIHIDSEKRENVLDQLLGDD